MFLRAEMAIIIPKNGLAAKLRHFTQLFTA